MAKKRIPVAVRKIVDAVCHALETLPEDARLEWTWCRSHGEEAKYSKYRVHVYPLDVETVGGPEDGRRTPAALVGELTEVIQAFDKFFELHLSTSTSESLVDGQTVVDLPSLIFFGSIRGVRLGLYISFTSPPLLAPGLLLDVNSGRRRTAS